MLQTMMNVSIHLSRHNEEQGVYSVTETVFKWRQTQSWPVNTPRDMNLWTVSVDVTNLSARSPEANKQPQSVHPVAVYSSFTPFRLDTLDVWRYLSLFISASMIRG